MTPIGVIHSEHHDLETTPIQPVCAVGCTGCVEVFEAYEDGLLDLEGFSHIHLLYWLHRAPPGVLRTMPYLEDVEHGIFATRFPQRPNPPGLSLVRLRNREGRFLFIEDVDILDGTPLLDIKPYVQRFDRRDDVRCGWTDGVDQESFERRGKRRA